MRIDSHTHIFNDTAYADYRKKADEVDRMITIQFSATEAPPKYSLDDLLRFAATKNDLHVVVAFNCLHDHAMQLAEIEEAFRRSAIVGAKIYPGYQPLYPYDAAIDSLAELCIRFKKPLICHSGDLSTHIRGAQLEYARPIHIDRLALKFPDLKIVMAHMGFPYLLEAAMVINKNANVYADLSGTIDRPSSDEEGKRLVDYYVADLKRAFAYFPAIKAKVMFGTDYGGEHTALNQVEPYFDVIERVFEPADRTSVFGGLAEKLFFV
jgi:uncharacterized protein